MALFSRVKNWVSGEVLYAADLNNEFNNLLNGFTPNKIDGASSNLTNMQITVDPDPAGVPSQSTDLLGELQRLRFQVKNITGEDQWYKPAVQSLATLKPRVDALFTYGQNVTVKTDGTDPGVRGFVSNPITTNLALTAAGGETDLATAILSRFGKETIVGVKADGDGFLTACNSNSTTCLLFGTWSLTLKLYRNGVLSQTKKIQRSFHGYNNGTAGNADYREGLTTGDMYFIDTTAGPETVTYKITGTILNLNGFSGYNTPTYTFTTCQVYAQEM